MADSKSANEAVEIAQQEIEYRVELFNKYSNISVTGELPVKLLRRMVNSCYDKCVEKKMKDQSLSVGESSCIDRCASKYWQVLHTRQFSRPVKWIILKVVAIVGQLLAGQKPAT